MKLTTLARCFFRVSLPCAAVFCFAGGNDANPGTLKSPSPHCNARNRRCAKSGDVFLRGGTYYLPAPLVFTTEDSGTEDAPVVFQNYQGEKPVISAASDWKNSTGSLTRTGF